MLKTLKDIFLYTIILLPFFLIYEVLEMYLGDSWWPAIIVSTLMIIARIGLYMYCRAKGINEKWD